MVGGTKGHLLPIQISDLILYIVYTICTTVYSIYCIPGEVVRYVLQRERENINRKKLEMGWENVGDRDGKESGHHGVGQSR